MPIFHPRFYFVFVHRGYEPPLMRAPCRDRTDVSGLEDRRNDLYTNDAYIIIVVTDILRPIK